MGITVIVGGDILEKVAETWRDSFNSFLPDLDEDEKKDISLKIAYKVLESSSNGVAITDEAGNIQWVNSAFSHITGYESHEVIGENPRVLKSQHHNKEFYSNMWLDLVNKGQWKGEIWNRRKSGETYPEWMIISAIKDGEGNTIQYVSVFDDMTERIKQKEYIKHQAYHDPLTGLSNQFLFRDRLDSSILHAINHKEKFGVLILGIDRFKRINDTLGHAVGDKILKVFGEKIVSFLNPDDTASRFSGDIFAIIKKGVDHIEDLVLLANEIVDEITKPYLIDEQEIYITTSIGISLYPEDGKKSEQLINNAEAAMFRAKDMGRNNYQLYTSSMNEKALLRLSMENDLHKAVQEGELILHYQPQIDTRTGEIIGAEALVRWAHPKLGMVGPVEFIPLAEETGLIIPLGEWVLREACMQNMKWQERGLPNIKIGVNLSPLQFNQTTILDRIKSILDTTKLSPKYLDLEITESSAMQNPNYTDKILYELKDMGVKISIDDFGTGYSSLAYLRQFPIDRIKIDKSFVQGVPLDKGQRAIVKAIIAMAKSFNIDTIAEGVETVEQLTFLKQQRCFQMQGYYYSKPVDADTFEKMLIKGHMN